jgi:hypothetical protein
VRIVRRRHVPTLLRPLAVLTATSIAVLVLVGCVAKASPSAAPTASASVVPSPMLSLAPAGPLVTIETRGGECPQGACGSTVIVEADGRVHQTASAPLELGTLSSVSVEVLATEIDKADFAALMSRPFTGTCPVAFDGQETVYTFATASGTIRIATCEIEVDPSDPLFVAVTAALTEVAAP